MSSSSILNALRFKADTCNEFSMRFEKAGKEHTTAKKFATEKAVANQAEASQEALFAKITKDTEEVTAAVKAAARKEFKAETGRRGGCGC